MALSAEVREKLQRRIDELKKECSMTQMTLIMKLILIW